MSLLPVTPAHALAPLPDERRWLIDALWGDEAVGIVGGEPKCCKSFLALDLATSVASGAPCLGRFTPAQTGRVLLYAAEDALHLVRERLQGICHAKAVTFDTLDIQVITAPTLRLDLPHDQDRLTETTAALMPKLLVLDPFVRLHRIDENASGEVAPLLAFLRDLQRRFHTAVLVVHHARKSAGRLRDGQALRGSSEFHAWVDSALYLRRTGNTLSLSVEHRAATSQNGLTLALNTDGNALALTIVDPAPKAQTTNQAASPRARIQQALADVTSPLPPAALRNICRLRTASFYQTLTALCSEGRVRKTDVGYELVNR